MSLEYLLSQKESVKFFKKVMGACHRDIEGTPTGHMWNNLITKVQSKLLEKREFIIHTNNKKGCEECS